MKIEAVVVCVEYDDMLAEVLGTWLFGQRVFDRILVVTTPHDHRTAQLAADAGLDTYFTWDFYQGDAAFNKGAAIETALGSGILALDDWVCFLDADIALPPGFRQVIEAETAEHGRDCLYGCQRLLAATPMQWRQVHVNQGSLAWTTGGLRRVRETPELAGCFHLFHTAARPRPWYPTDWQHAGGYDSVFEQSWGPDKKHRIAAPVVHLGEPGKNWHGRTEPRFDGAEIDAEPDVLAARLAARTDREQRRRDGTPAIENKNSRLEGRG